MKIRIVGPGKIKKGYYRAAVEDYAGRIRRFVPLEIIETREESVRDGARHRRVRKESEAIEQKLRSDFVVVLDPEGRQMTSEEFAAFLGQVRDSVDFVLGGPVGVQVKGAHLVLSFGKITLPHDLSRVILLEQIYRALTILKKIPYHK